MTATATASSAAAAGYIRLNSGGFHGFAYSIAIAVTILLLIATLTLIIYYYLRWKNKAATAYQRRSAAAAATEIDDVEQGIDETALKSFPEVMYGEDGVGSTSNDIVCSICLSDYKKAQILRLLPDCGHMFHGGCVDEWLRRHPTCPICRSTPLPSPSITPREDSN